MRVGGHHIEVCEQEEGAAPVRLGRRDPSDEVAAARRGFEHLGADASGPERRSQEFGNRRFAAWWVHRRDLDGFREELRDARAGSGPVWFVTGLLCAG